jgi:RNA polymerase sigma-70 factor, ECF subfamily
VTLSEAAETLDLVRRLAGDESAALERAYELYGGRCNAIAFRILQSDEAARDTVQEVFLSLWRHRHGLVVRTGGLLPWLVVVTRNAAIAMLRSDAWRARREERFNATKAEPAPSDPLDLAATQSDVVRLRGALRSLPPEQQNVVELAYFKFLTMAQIAERTATPVGTVKRRAQLALRHLARLLHEGAS